MKDKTGRVSRRDFLKRTGTTLIAAGALAGLGTWDAPAKTPEKQSRKIRPVDEGWDVIVAGGGPAGVAAAIASAREGAKTLLIESTGMLGGMSTAGNMNAWCPFTDGEKVIYKGIAEKILIESKKGMVGAPNDWLPINTEQLKRVYDDAVSAAGVHVMFFSMLADVEMAGNGRVDHVVVANKNGLSRYRAKVYVDCTGDGDLAAWAGADYFYGDESGKVQDSSLCFTIAGVNREEYRKRGGDGWLHNKSAKSPIHKILESGKYPLIPDQHVNAKEIHPGVVVFNAGHIPDVRSVDPEHLTRAMMQGRRLVEEMHRAFIEECPEVFGASFLSSTGSLIGIRESRRIKGDHLFTIDDWVARRSFDDGIGRNCYYIDVHIDGAVSYPRYARGESHGIPFRCLVPKKLSNVLVAGRPISCDEYSFGSLRVMPVCLVTGEAAGLGAALASRMGRVDVHDIDIVHLRKRLQQEGQNI
jgi:hypothetical protein